MKIILFLFVLICSAGINAQPAGFGFGKQILIQSSQVSGTANLIDFTVLINVTDPDLRTVLNGGKVESINGYDIIFTEGDCETQLEFQIEKYVPTTGEFIAWVKIPALFATVDYGIHMYYGNSAIVADPSSTGAWESNYEAVWHMNNDPSNSSLTDYTGNGVNGTSAGSMTSSDLVAGQIGDAIDFDGSNDYFALASKSYTGTNAIPTITITAWVNTSFVANGAFNNWSILDFDRSESFNIFVHGDGRLGFATDGSGISDSYAGTAGDLNDGNWHYVAGVYDGTDKLLYIDGNLVLTVTNPHGGNGLGSNSTRFGFIGDGSEATTFNGNRNNIYYDGMYDEIRFTTNALSGDWIQTEYNNQNSPSTFYAISTEYMAGDLCTILPIELIYFSVEDFGKNVMIDWETASELNNEFFTIERSSNGTNWEIVNTVEGAGNSQTVLKYSDVDASPYNGVSYYRLKQTDFDGNFEYSQIRSVSVERLENSSIEIYPNPFNQNLTIAGDEVELQNMRIFNSQGQDLTAMTKVIISNENKRVIDFNQLTKGFYFIKTKTRAYKVYKQ